MDKASRGSSRGVRPASNEIRSFFMTGETGQNGFIAAVRKMRQGNG
jgi:hypothetical protein